MSALDVMTEAITVAELRERFRQKLAEDRARAHRAIDLEFDLVAARQDVEFERLEMMVLDPAWKPT